MQILSWLGAALFPPKCVVCGAEGAMLCAAHNQWQAAAMQADLPGPLPLHACVVYGDDTTTRAIEALKYYGQHGILAALRAAIISNPPQLPADAILVPVPLHWTRQLWRGFNQAERIAQVFSGLSGAPVVPLLRRTRRTQQQAKLSQMARHVNTAGAFLVHPQYTHMLRNHTLVLIDDVAATGATLVSAADALCQAGAQNVQAVVLARPRISQVTRAI